MTFWRFRAKMSSLQPKTLFRRLISIEAVSRNVGRSGYEWPRVARSPSRESLFTLPLLSFGHP